MLLDTPQGCMLTGRFFDVVILLWQLEDMHIGCHIISIFPSMIAYVADLTLMNEMKFNSHADKVKCLF